MLWTLTDATGHTTEHKTDTEYQQEIETTDRQGPFTVHGVMVERSYSNDKEMTREVVFLSAGRPK
jgi:hypothetical protein